MFSLVLNIQICLCEHDFTFNISQKNIVCSWNFLKFYLAKEK